MDFHNLVKPCQPYAEFVTMLNTVVKRYADILAQQKGRRKATKGNGEEVSE